MPLLLHKKINGKSSLGIWLIEEQPDFFYKHLGEKPALIEKQVHKQLEKLAARHLINIISGKTIHNKLIYDAFGKPFLQEDPKFISFSHKFPYVAVLMSESPFTGIDIERLGETPYKLRSKFVSPHDRVGTLTDNPLEQATLIWSAKECLYKVYGKKALDFKQHLRVWVNSDGKLMGLVHKNTHKLEIELQYFKFQNHTVVHTL